MAPNRRKSKTKLMNVPVAFADMLTERSQKIGIENPDLLRMTTASVNRGQSKFTLKKKKKNGNYFDLLMDDDPLAEFFK